MEYMDNEMIEWIKSHSGDDTMRLRLKYGSDLMLSNAILQIECRGKCSSKLKETLSNPRFMFPTALSAEQCTSDDLAEFHASLIPAGSDVLDMTCGLGIDSFHISRRAGSVFAVELNPEIARAARHNSTVFGLDNIRIVEGDSVKFLDEDPNRKWDVIFIDPARRGTGGKRLFALSDCNPDVVALYPKLQSHSRVLIIKASPMLDIKRTLLDLPLTSRLFILGYPNECKELVAFIDFSGSPTECIISAVTVGRDEFSFSLSEEQDAPEARIDMPTPGMWLYEPYPAVMKASPFKLLASRFNLAKPDRHTHLYLSTEKCNFPGKRFRIVDVMPFNKNTIRQFNEKWPKINVATRNFIMGADDLAKRLKVSPGDKLRAIGIKSPEGYSLLISEEDEGMS